MEKKTSSYVKTSEFFHARLVEEHTGNKNPLWAFLKICKFSIHVTPGTHKKLFFN